MEESTRRSSQAVRSLLLWHALTQMLREGAPSSLFALLSLMALAPSCSDEQLRMRVHGRLLNAEGRPVVASKVTLDYLFWTPASSVSHYETKLTDSLGRYEFDFEISAADTRRHISITASSAEDESSIYGGYDLIGDDDNDVVMPDLSFWSAGVVVTTDDEGRRSLTWNEPPDGESPCYAVRFNSVDATDPFFHTAWAAGPMQLPTYLVPAKLAEDSAFKAYVFTTYSCSAEHSMPDTRYVAAPVVVPAGILAAPSRGDRCFIATESGNVLLTSGAGGVCPLTDGDFAPVSFDDCVDATCGQQGPHDVLIDLGGQTAIQTIVVRGLRTAGWEPPSVDIEVSSDGEVFDLVGTATDTIGEGFVLKELSPPWIGRWVRIHVSELPIWQISEIAVF